MVRLKLSGCTVDLGSGIASRPEGAAVRLTTREAALLRYLVGRPGRLVTRTELLTEVWGYAPSVTSRAADNAMRRLRTKLERDPGAPEHLVTVHGKGYRFEPLIHRDPAATPIPVQRSERDPDFVGRSRVLEQVRSELARRQGLITLVGTGGIGKTELARRLEPEAVWADLADLSESDGEAGVLTAICLATGVPAKGSRERRLQRLVRVLSRAPLVVLDNCENAVDALGPLVAELVAGGVRVLGTSRIRLGVHGEQVVELPRLEPADAARLFVRRATQARSGREPAFEAEDVAGLVEALDGIPLAIELAAAQAAILTPEQLLERLDLDLLRGRGGRFETMRAAIASSWNGLDERDRRALALLSRLPGGFSSEMVGRILGPDGAARLRSLREAHLIRPGRPGRWAPFHPVREFAREQPISARERAGLIEAFAELGAVDFLDSTAYRQHLARGRQLEDELPNALALLPLSLTHAPEHAVALARAAAHVILARGPVNLGVSVTDEVLHLAASGVEAAELFRVRSLLLRWHGDAEGALVAAERAHELAPEGSVSQARAKMQLALLAADDLDYDEAIPRYLAAAAALERTGRPELGALCRCRAAFYDHKNIDAAIVHGERAIRLADEKGELFAYALAADYVGKICWHAWRLDDALAYTRIAQDAQVHLGMVDVNGFTCITRIQLLLASGDHDGLLEDLDRGTAIWHRVGDAAQEGLIHGLRGHYHSCRGEPDRAIECFADSRRLLRGFETLPHWWSLYLEAFFWVARGDLVTAEPILVDALAGLMGHGTAEHVAVAQSLHAEVRARLGDADAARALVRAAQPAIDAVAYPPSRIAWAIGRGWAAHAAGDADQARQALVDAQRIAAEHGIDSPLSPSTIEIEGLREVLRAR